MTSPRESNIRLPRAIGAEHQPLDDPEFQARVQEAEALARKWLKPSSRNMGFSQPTDPRPRPHRDENRHYRRGKDQRLLRDAVRKAIVGITNLSTDSLSDADIAKLRKELTSPQEHTTL